MMCGLLLAVVCSFSPPHVAHVGWVERSEAHRFDLPLTRWASLRSTPPAALRTPPAKTPEKVTAPVEEPPPNFVWPYLVGALCVAAILVVVCLPSRRQEAKQ